MTTTHPDVELLLPTCDRCDRSMRPHLSKAADYPGTVATQRTGLCQACHRGYRARDLGPVPAVTSTPGRLTPDETEQAACTRVDGDAWYPDTKDAAQAAAAKSICGTCPIRTRCLEVALTNRERDGIWGGLDPTERAALLRDQNRSAAA